MTASPEPAPAMQPEDLGEFFLERANPPAAGWQLAVGDRSAGPAVVTKTPQLEPTYTEWMPR
jgi:hypothetical protein